MPGGVLGDAPGDAPAEGPKDPRRDAPGDALADAPPAIRAGLQADVLADPAADVPAHDADALDEAAQRTAMDRVLIPLRGGDVAAAADALAAARTAGTLTLAQEMGLSDALLAALAHDEDLPGAAVLHAAARLGWDGKAAAWASPQLWRLHDRVAAERWLLRLRQQGKAWRAWLGGHRAGAARLLLGRGRPVLAWVLPPEPHLSRMVAEYGQHEDWLRHRLDPRRVGLVRRMLAQPFPRIAAWLWYGMAAAVWLGLGLLPGAWGWMGFTMIWAGRWLRRVARTVILLVVLCLLGAATVTALSHDLFETPARRLARLADGGDADAAWALAGMLSLGQGVPEDPAGAARRYRQALPRHPEAAAPLGAAYEDGSGVPTDPAAARRWYAQAAALGNAEGQAGLGWMLLHGAGGPVDTAAGLDLSRRAAQQGSARGMLTVGMAYLEGTGVPRDPARAARWLEAAANHVSAPAMATLAGLHLFGTGVPKSAADAYVWAGAALRLAGASSEAGRQAAAIQDMAAQGIDPAERAALDLKARSWFWDRRPAPSE